MFLPNDVELMPMRYSQKESEGNINFMRRAIAALWTFSKVTGVFPLLKSDGGRPRGIA